LDHLAPHYRPEERRVSASPDPLGVALLKIKIFTRHKDVTNSKLEVMGHLLCVTNLENVGGTEVNVISLFVWLVLDGWC
jgi:hypothetical protein